MGLLMEELSITSKVGVLPPNNKLNLFKLTNAITRLERIQGTGEHDKLYHGVQKANSRLWETW